MVDLGSPNGAQFACRRVGTPQVGDEVDLPDYEPIECQVATGGLPIGGDAERLLDACAPWRAVEERFDSGVRWAKHRVRRR
jgi:hypothetical protein